jgi:hypothetical protein
MTKEFTLRFMSQTYEVQGAAGGDGGGDDGEDSGGAASGD